MKDLRTFKPSRFFKAIVVLIFFIFYLGITYTMRRGGDPDPRMQLIPQIGAFKNALHLYQIDNGHYPTGTNGLNALVVKPPDATSDWHPYMDEIPLDPWGHPYLYECPGRHNPAGFDVGSAGPDGKFGTKDDIGNWDSSKQ